MLLHVEIPCGSMRMILAVTCRVSCGSMRMIHAVTCSYSMLFHEDNTYCYMYRLHAVSWV